MTHGVVSALLTLVAGAMLLAGCEEVQPITTRTLVANVAPGQASVWINGVEVARVGCGEIVGLTAGGGAVPALPWTVVIRGPTGRLVGTLDLAEPPPVILVLDEEIQASLTTGPSFEPAARCGSG